MKKLKNIMVKAGKLLFASEILFSQLSFPIGVLADELTSEEKTILEEQITEENEQSSSSEENEQSSEEETNEEETSSEITEGEETNGEESSEEDVEGTTDSEETTPSEDDTSEGNTDDTTGDTTDGDSENDNSGEDEEVLTIIISYSDTNCIIKSELTDTITLKTLAENISDSFKVVTSDDEEVTEETLPIYNGYKLFITDLEGNETEYIIVILGDYDNNGYVNSDDMDAMKELLFVDEISDEVMTIVDVNQDGEFNVLDLTASIFTDGTWDNEVTASDELSSYMFTNEDDVYEDGEVTVTYYIDGFSSDSLKGIEGDIVYDDTVLSLSEVTVNGTYSYLEIVDNHFVILLDDYSETDGLITVTFTTLTTGDASVSIDNIITSVGGVEANIDVTKVSTSFTILENGKGGDSDTEDDNTTSTEDDNTSTTTTTSTQTSTTNKAEVYQVPATKSTTTTTSSTQTVSLSTDNYIKSLVIDGYDIDFDMYTYEYSITVKSSVKSLDLDITLNDSSASYEIDGNKNFKTGENVVNIVVTSESGEERTYKITVTKEKASSSDTDDDEEVEEESSSSKTIIIILIVLVIIGLIYVIFKDDEDDKKESKK